MSELPADLRRPHAFPNQGTSITDASPTEIAWAAGLFEGEGSVLANPNRKHGMPKLALNMTDLDVIGRYAVIVGGHVTGPYKSASRHVLCANPKPLYSWSEGRREVVPLILSAFWPYLGERRRTRAQEVGFSYPL